MKVTMGVELARLREAVRELQASARTIEGQRDAAYRQHTASLDVVKEIFHKMVQNGQITAIFAACHVRNICDGKFNYKFTDRTPTEIQDNLQDLVEEFRAMFTQQHYEKLAEILRDTRRDISSGANSQSVSQIHDKMEGIGQFQLRLMAALKKDNPKFKDLIFIGSASEHAPAKR